MNGQNWPARAPRRKLPLGRLAVLQTGGRSHIVGLADVSVSGAFLITRVPLVVGGEYMLNLVLAAGSELNVLARVVRVRSAADPGGGHPQGSAVQFLELDPVTRKRIQEFVASGAKPAV